MSVSVPNSSPAGRPVQPVRISPDLALAAAKRLVSQSSDDVDAAARRLVASAPSHGIDLSLVWGTVDSSRGKKHVRQACLAVPGAGRTAMLFISEPPKGGDFGDVATATAERAAVIEAACAHLAEHFPGSVHIAQALPEPTETWSIDAFSAAAFIKVGALAYLKRQAGAIPKGVAGRVALADGVTITRVDGLSRIEMDRQLVTAMDRSYIDTQDCPELCGLRETSDILESHKATGEFDPTSWWLVSVDGEPEGCGLFSPCPEMGSAELVYLGLSPRMRGKGLGRHLLTMGVEEFRKRKPGWPMTLAVDRRNVHALRLYGDFGFRSFGERVALVKPVNGLAR